MRAAGGEECVLGVVPTHCAIDVCDSPTGHHASTLREHCCGQAACREATSSFLETRVSRCDRLLRSPRICLLLFFSTHVSTPSTTRSSQAPCKRHSTLRLPRLHAQPDAVNRGHTDERARLPAVGRVRANGMREAVHDAVRRGAIEDERVARLNTHRRVPHVEVHGEAKGEEDDPVAQRVDMVR